MLHRRLDIIKERLKIENYMWEKIVQCKFQTDKQKDMYHEVWNGKVQYLI